MEALRSEKVTVNLTAETARHLDRFANDHNWTRSTAADVLIRRGLDADEREQARGTAA
jgi:hypothetical protein